MVLHDNTLPKILLVDDKSENIAILIDMLEPLHLDVYVALSAKETYQRVEETEFDLILLDILMPDIDGYEVCQNLKSSLKHKDIPLIFISSLGGIEDKIKGFSYGADDYITKPVVSQELQARVKLHLQKGLLFKSLKGLLRKSYHELYNPLAIINTSIEMHNIKYGSNKYTDAITVGSRTLQCVYDDLYYSLSNNTQHSTLTTINLSDFIQGRIDFFHYLSKSRNITVELKRLKKSLINFKEMDLQRIVDNTLSNAIKYAKEYSTVSINILNTKESIIFESKNIGTPIKNPQNIFNKGYREGFEQIGMGIGLEIVASICDNYHIEPEVISNNEETIFRYAFSKENR